jgi:hypothetical protein
MSEQQRTSEQQQSKSDEAEGGARRPYAAPTLVFLMNKSTENAQGGASDGVIANGTYS